MAPPTTLARISSPFSELGCTRFCLSVYGVLDGCWHSSILLAIAYGPVAPCPPLKLYNRSWVIHTRTEERPPARLPAGAHVQASMICDGCFIEPGAVESSVLSPGVHIGAGAVVRESIILTDCVIENGAVVERAIVDKRAVVKENARIGGGVSDQNIRIALVGKSIPYRLAIGLNRKPRSVQMLLNRITMNPLSAPDNLFKHGDYPMKLFDRSGGILFLHQVCPAYGIGILVHKPIILWTGSHPRVVNCGRCFHWGLQVMAIRLINVSLPLQGIPISSVLTR